MSGDGLPFKRPQTRDGHEIHTGYYVRLDDGRIGRVRAFDGWGKLQLVIQAPHEIRGHEVQASKVDFSHKGF